MHGYQWLVIKKTKTFRTDLATSSMTLPGADTSPGSQIQWFRHGISMALIEIDGLPNLIAWWIFPWQTVC